MIFQNVTKHSKLKDLTQKKNIFYFLIKKNIPSVKRLIGAKKRQLSYSEKIKNFRAYGTNPCGPY